MNVPPEKEIKRMWWAEQSEAAREHLKPRPEIARDVFKHRGILKSRMKRMPDDVAKAMKGLPVESVVNVTPDGDASVYENQA